MNYSDLVEKKKHGTNSFPLEYYYIDENHPRYVMVTHWHKEYEIIRVLKGKLKVFLNTAEYELFENDCMLIEGGCLKRAEPTDCIYECVVFDTAILERKSYDIIAEKLGEALKEKVTVDNLVKSEEKEIVNVIFELFDTMRDKENYYEINVVAQLYKLFFVMLANKKIKKEIETETETNRCFEVIISLIKWIDHNFAEEISLKKLSNMFGFSEKYLCRIFKQYTSKTIIEYVNECRVEKACLLLKQTTITEAALYCGFNDISYFSKIFKKQKGITPREYKKQMLR